MAQQRIFQFHDFDAAATHNARLARVIEPGVYQGYWLVPNPYETDVLDITVGEDLDSRLVTKEGITVVENAAVLGAVRIQPAHRTLTRKDLVVARYRFSNDPSTLASYTVIRGVTQSSLDEEPQVPSPGADDVPVAVVVVRPPANATSGSGTSTAQIDQTDIIPVPRAGDMTVEEMSSLKPFVDPVSRDRLFVQAGNFPNGDRTAVVRFQGGYSTAVDPDGSLLVAGGAALYFMFAISDDESVTIAASATTVAGLPAIETDVVPIAIVKARRNVAGLVEITQLIDVRMPISRATQPVSETEKYRTGLTNSVFKFAVIDPIVSEEFLDLTRVGFDAGASTALVSDDGITAEVLAGNSSLKVAYDGVAGSAAVGVATKDLLNGIQAEVGPLLHFLVQIDADADVAYDYSISGPDTGYTGNRYRTGQMVSIPRTTSAAGRLFLRFFFPRTVLDAPAPVSVFSYAVYMQLDTDQINQFVLSELGIGTVTSLIPNMLANGDFRYWSRLDNDALLPDIDAVDQIDYPFSIAGDDVTNHEKMFAADGWMFVERAYEARDGVVSRVTKSVIADATDTALEFIGASGVVGPRNVLEYRVPRIVDMQGQFVTFAFEAETTLTRSIGARIVFYKRGADGVLTVKSVFESTLGPASGTVILTTSEAISADVAAIGFGIVFLQSTAEVAYTVFQARAALGQFRVLPYNRHPSPDQELRHFYERGRIVTASDVEAGVQVASSAQMRASKYTSLIPNRTVRARVLQDASFDRSSNVQGQTVTAESESVVVSAVASATGPVSVDVDWEADVIYTRT